MRAKLFTIFIFGIPTMIFILLVWYASPDFRGDDQYWYLADVETLLKGEPAKTNNVYPVHVFSEEYPQPVPFLHNILNLYFVLPAAWFFGPFYGWVITNGIASILTATLLALLTARFSGLLAAGVTYSLYLLLPLTLRQTSQINAEATTAPWIALGVCLYVWSGEKKWLWPIIVFVAVITYYCQIAFLPVVIILPFVYLWQNKPFCRKTMLMATCFCIFAFTAVILKSVFFPEAISNSISDILNTQIPGKTDSMYAYFNLCPLPLSAQNLWHKFTTHFIQQFFPCDWRWQIFYIPYNFAVMFAGCLFFTKLCHPKKRLFRCAIILFGLHLVTIMLTQNTFRYLLISTPAILPAAVVLFFEIKLRRHPRVNKAIFTVAFGLLLIADGLLVSSLRRNALHEGKTRSTMKTKLNSHIGPQDKVIVEAITNKYQLVGYVLKPRAVIYVESYYTEDQYRYIQEKTEAQWLLCSRFSKILPWFLHSPEPVLKDFPTPYQNHVLFRLTKPSKEHMLSFSKQKAGVEKNNSGFLF